MSWYDLDLTFDLVIVTCVGYFLDSIRFRRLTVGIGTLVRGCRCASWCDL